jgi:geranylgeranyl diphosphate synthase, type I
MHSIVAASRQELIAALTGYVGVMTPDLIRMGKFVLSSPGKALYMPESAGDDALGSSLESTPLWVLNVVLPCIAALRPEEKDEWRRALPGVVAVELAMAAADLLDELADEDPSPFVREFGPGQALNTGSLMLVMAQQTLLRSAQDDMEGGERALRALAALQEMLVQAAVGQHLDMLYDKMEPGEVDLEMSAHMTDLKAGALVSGAARIGAILSGADEQVVETIARFGKEAGCIAQLINDVQDVMPLPAEAGAEEKGLPERKTDIRLRKRTLPIVFALRDDSPVPNALQLAFRGEGGQIDDEEMRRAVVAAGGVNFANLLSEVHRQKALEALDDLEELRPGARDILIALLPPAPV